MHLKNPGLWVKCCTGVSNVRTVVFKTLLETQTLFLSCQCNLRRGHPNIYGWAGFTFSVTDIITALKFVSNKANAHYYVHIDHMTVQLICRQECHLVRAGYINCQHLRDKLGMSMSTLLSNQILLFFPAGPEFFFVGRNNGSLHPCIHFRGLNDITIDLLSL